MANNGTRFRYDLSGCLLPALLIAALASLGLVERAEAIATTYHAEATINLVQDTLAGGVILPVDIQVGRTISLTWRFESISGANRSRHTQDLGIEIPFGSFRLATPTYDVFVENDAIGRVGMNPFGPKDSYNLGVCSITTPACPVLESPGILWSALMGLGDEEGSSLDHAWLESDPVRLNLFANRELSLGFLPAMGDGGTVVYATVGPITLVPEPSAALYLGVGLAALTHPRRAAA